MSPTSCLDVCLKRAAKMLVLSAAVAPGFAAPNGTWTPLAHAPARVASGVLLLSAMTGAILALGAGVLINATEEPEPERHDTMPVAGLRIRAR